MQRVIVGDVAIDSITERSGPWRAPEAMFPAFEAEAGGRYLGELGPIHYDAASNRLNITYQTFVVRTPRHTILVDTCTGEDKGFPPHSPEERRQPSLNYFEELLMVKQPWLN